MKYESTENEIKRQLALKSEVTCVGPPYVVLNGEKLIQELQALRKVRDAAEKLRLGISIESTQSIIKALDAAKEWKK